MRLRISRIHWPVTALGPGRRLAVWVQGCGIGCRGCVSQDTWDRAGGHSVALADLHAACLAAVADGCTGITISGGEPFDQAPALATFLAGLATAPAVRDAELDVLCFSGYPLARLRRRHAVLLSRLDAVISGPYVAGRPTDLVWRGSANQELVVLTPLGAARYAEHVHARPARPAFQVHVGATEVSMIGIPRPGDLEQVRGLVAARGVTLDAVSWSA